MILLFQAKIGEAKLHKTEMCQFNIMIVINL